MLKLPDKIYDILKWILLIVVPAFNLLIEKLTELWQLDIPIGAITGTLTAFALFFGVILGISSYNYNKENKVNHLN